MQADKTQKIEKNGAKKIFSRLDMDQYNRLTEIVKKYHFKSEYEIIQYCVACFLRVADPQNDPESEPLSQEIENMFHDLGKAERNFEFVKPKRKAPAYSLGEMNGEEKIWHV